MSKGFGLNRSFGAAVILIALVAAANGLISLNALKSVGAATDATERSAGIVREVDAFEIAMLDQETGLRGYLLTGRKDSLEPYEAGRRALIEATEGLHALVGASGPQAERLAVAEASAAAWQKEIGQPAVLAMKDPAGKAQAVAFESGGEGKRHFDAFRERLGAISDVEARNLRSQNAVLARARRDATAALWIGAIITLLICGLVGIAMNRMIVVPLTELAGAMHRLARRDLDVEVPGTRRRSEVGEMARAVSVFKDGLVELDRTSLLRVTTDTLPAMVGYIDAKRRVGFLNGEFASWFDLQVEDVSQVVGRPLASVFAEGRFPGATRELEAAFAGDETRSEHRLARGSGRRDVEAFFRPHRAADGRVLGVVALLTDITERKGMERRLAVQKRDLTRSNEELEQFAYVASHDLKAPLRGIENLVGWIEEDLEGTLTGETRTNMDLLRSRVRRLESLLDDLLAYSRAGRSEATFETIDVGGLVEDLVALISPPEGFTVQGSTSLPTLRSARTPLTQALQNLIGNAIKHHDRPAEGHVWVDARDDGETIEFSVADDGPGVPPQYRDRVFGMFQTLRPRDEVEGSGMGLAIVRKLVDRQGGSIWIADGRNGRGADVRFTWPRDPKGAEDGTDGEPASHR